VKQLLADGKIAHQEFLLTDDQARVLSQVGFPDPMGYLQ